MYATSHTTGDFDGILMGTTHFIDVVSQELHSDGFIMDTPFDEHLYEQHMELWHVCRKNKEHHEMQSRSEKKNVIRYVSKNNGG